MPRPESAPSPEEMGLPKEKKPKLEVIEGGKEAEVLYNEAEARDLENRFKKMVAEGFLDAKEAQRQIKEIRERTVEMEEEVFEEPLPEKAEILGKEYERKISYEDIPTMFEALNDTRDLGLITGNEARRQKLELLRKLQDQSGWRLLDNVNLQELLTREKFSKQEVSAIIDNVRESYDPRSDKWGAARNYQEIDNAATAWVIDEEDAKYEKLNLIKGVESSIGIDLSKAKELAEKGKLNAEEFEAMVSDRLEQGIDEKDIEKKRKELGIKPILMSNIENDEINMAIHQQLENIEGFLKTGEATAEEAAEMRAKKKELLDLRREIELGYNVVDISEAPHLIRSGELSAERARDMLGQEADKYQSEAKAIENAIKYTELKKEDEIVAKSYSLIDQLNAAGKLDFKSADLISLKEEITTLGSKLYRARKEREGRGIFGRMAGFIRSKFSEAGKKEEAAMQADQAKFAELLQQRADMESKFWSVAQLSSENQDVLVKYNVFERKQTKKEAELAELQIFPQRIESVMNSVLSGEMDVEDGLERIREYQEIAKKGAEFVAEKAFDVDQVRRAAELIEKLNEKGLITFNRENFIEALAQTRSSSSTPDMKIDARKKLLAMEREIYDSINKSEWGELGEVIRAFRE